MLSLNREQHLCRLPSNQVQISKAEFVLLRRGILSWGVALYWSYRNTTYRPFLSYRFRMLVEIIDGKENTQQLEERFDDILFFSHDVVCDAVNLSEVRNYRYHKVGRLARNMLEMVEICASDAEIS